MTSNILTGKYVVFDYFSVTFDFIEVKEFEKGNYVIDPYNKNLIKLLKLFNINTHLYELKNTSTSLHGYSNCRHIGEHIKLLYGSNFTVNRFGHSTCNLLMTGEACREFINKRNGKWTDLFNFFLSFGAEYIVSFKRIDIAIDDYEGSLNIYNLVNKVRNKEYTSPLKKWNVTESGSKDGEKHGLTITLGSTGSNQLVIYDKNAERRSKDEPTQNTNIWYRWELRFTDEKAEKVISQWLLAVGTNNSKTFMEFKSELLFQLFQPKIVDTNDSNKSRWKVIPEYLSFLESIEKIDISAKKKELTSFNRKLEWFERSISPTLTEIYIVQTRLGISFKEAMEKMILKKGETFDSQQLERINYHLSEYGGTTFNKVADIQNFLDEKLKEASDDEWDPNDLPF